MKRIAGSAYLGWQAARQPRIPFLPIEKIRHLQARNIRAMVAHAYGTVAYYKETLDQLGLCVDQFQSADDLARLPVIDRSQLQANPEYFTSKAQGLQSYVHLRTGGSLGDPHSVYHSTRGIMHNAGHGERERWVVLKHLGRRLGYRETVLISNSSTCRKLQGMSASRSILPARLAITRQYLSLMDPPEFNVPLINDFQPDVIETYGSYLAMLFAYLDETGAKFHKPKFVRYSSDSLPENARKLITDRFGIPVFSAYQANEALKIGFECGEHAGYHLNIDLYPLRIGDGEGRPLPDGETGQVYVSNLVNTATVLLNYRLDDLAAIIPGKCPCGRSLPMLTFPTGRSDDWLEMPSGRAVHPQLARTVFTEESDVWQYQVIQETRTRFTVKVIVRRGADTGALQERVRKSFKERFGAEVVADVSFVDKIDRSRAGKFRPVISAVAAMRGSGLAEGAAR